MKTKKRDWELIRFCLIEAVYFAIFANYSYQSVWLKQIGITSTQLGLITAMGSLVGCISCFIWGTVSDRYGSSRKVFITIVTGSAVMYFFLPFVSAGGQSVIGLIFFYVPAIYFFRQAGTSMMDCWVAERLIDRGIPYGRARAWGSVGYAVMSAIWGVIIGVYAGTETVFYSFIPILILFHIICSKQKTPVNVVINKETASKVKVNPIKVLFKNRAFMMYMLYSFGLNIYIAVTVIFMPYILEHAGCKPEQIGIVTGFRAVVEVAAMFVGTRLAKKMPLRYILIIPGITFAIEHLCYQFAVGLGGMFAVIAFSGISGGLAFSIGPSYVYKIVPAEVKSRAQSLIAMNLTIVAILGTAVGGHVIDTFGVGTLTTGCGILIMVLTVIFAFDSLRHKNKNS